MREAKSPNFIMYIFESVQGKSSFFIFYHCTNYKIWFKARVIFCTVSAYWFLANTITNKIILVVLLDIDNCEKYDKQMQFKKNQIVAIEL